jgi:pyruvate,water dikinase
VSGLNGSVRLARERPMENDMTTVRYELDFSEISLSDVPQVGGKNASLGELYRALQSKGVGALSSCSV